MLNVPVSRELILNPNVTGNRTLVLATEIIADFKSVSNHSASKVFL